MIDENCWIGLKDAAWPHDGLVCPFHRSHRAEVGNLFLWKEKNHWAKFELNEIQGGPPITTPPPFDYRETLATRNTVIIHAASSRLVCEDAVGSEEEAVAACSNCQRGGGAGGGGCWGAPRSGGAGSGGVLGGGNTWKPPNDAPPRQAIVRQMRPIYGTRRYIKHPSTGLLRCFHPASAPVDWYWTWQQSWLTQRRYDTLNQVSSLPFKISNAARIVQRELCSKEIRQQPNFKISKKKTENLSACKSSHSFRLRDPHSIFFSLFCYL